MRLDVAANVADQFKRQWNKQCHDDWCVN
jgi:hypothetical protein